MTDNESSMDSLFAQAEQFEGKKAKIKCVGVGGGGGNAINHMMEAGVPDVDFIAINTDAKALSQNNAPYLMQVGAKKTKGLGVGGDPELGKEAAVESIEQLRLIAADTDLLFITAGMGGGTGTGVAPQLARVAKEIYGENILVIGVVTKPFAFEGPKKTDYADKGIEELQKYADSMIIIPNDRIFEIINPATDNEAAYKMINEVLLQAVKGISEVILKPMEMSIDYNDLKRIMLASGRSLIGIGQAKGNKRHLAAVNDALSSPLLENGDITGAKGFIVVFTAAKEISMLEQGEVMNIIRQLASNNSIIKFGYNYDSLLEPGVLKVTVIATGFAKDGMPPLPGLRGARRPVAQRGGPPAAPQQGGKLDAESDFLLIPAYIRRKKEVR
ncbi:MAG: cell division protein FtsZ [Elusimicrobiota bacterium]|jgi:cell division protein FtsZ|nr:cell division protein FtsZ [Elusimicrobiota bacterium]